MKKGILVTLTTLMLLFSIITFSSIYTIKVAEFKSVNNEQLLSSKIRYVSDDIFSNIYSDLLNLNISINRTEIINVNFTGNIYLNNNSNYLNKMKNYKSFIENEYSKLNNMNLEIYNFTPYFEISPYDSYINISEPGIILLNGQPYFKGAKLTFKLNANNYNSLDTLENFGPDFISIVLFNSTGQIIYDQTHNFNSSVKNSLNFSFNAGNLVINYGTYDIYPKSTLEIKSGIYTNIQNLNLVYEKTAEKTAIFGAALNIKKGALNFTKQNRIILTEE